MVTRFICALCPEKEFTARCFAERHVTSSHSGFGYQCSVCKAVSNRFDTKHPNCENSVMMPVKRTNMKYGEAEKAEFEEFQRERCGKVRVITRPARTETERNEGMIRKKRPTPINTAPMRKNTCPARPYNKKRKVEQIHPVPAETPTEIKKRKEEQQTRPVVDTTNKAKSHNNTNDEHDEPSPKKHSRKWLPSALSLSSSSSSSKSTSIKSVSDEQSSVEQESVVSKSKQTFVVTEKSDKQEAVIPVYIPTDKMLIKLKGLNHTQDTRILINVGGVKFETSAATLGADPSSVLARMTTGQSPMKPYQNGGMMCYFMDREPKHFATVLNYLRNISECYSRVLPNNAMILEELLMEAKFYELPGLVKIIESKLRSM